MEKLNLENFDEEMRNIILNLKEILTAQDISRIEDHLEFTKRAPNGIMDDMYIESPATTSLLMYGEMGLDALYRLAIVDRLVSGKILVPRLLLCAALQNLRFPFSEISRAQAYLDDDKFCEIIDKVKQNLENRQFCDTAQSYLNKLIHHYIVNPDIDFQIGHLFDTGMFIFSKEERQRVKLLLLKMISTNSILTREHSEQIRNYHERLLIHRSNLRHLRRQAASFGGEIFAPIPVVNQVAEQKKQIAEIKNMLYEFGEFIVDYPDEINVD